MRRLLEMTQTKVGDMTDANQVLAEDRQVLADVYWAQRERSRWALQLQMGLISATMAGGGLFGAAVALKLQGLGVAFMLAAVTGILGVWWVVSLARGWHDSSDQILLPSGEMVTVSPGAKAEVHRQMAAMADH